MMMQQPKSTGLTHFFFAHETPFGAAMVRILLPLAASLPMWQRLPRVRELYSSDGTPTQLFELFGNGPVLPVMAPGIVVPLYGIMLLCLAMAVVGFRTRLSLFVATPLYVYFNLLDAVGTMTKYSVIASHLLLLLALSSGGAVWSVDAYLKQRSRGYTSSVPPAFPVWPVRLMQLLFCFVYFGAAITKIQTAAFFSGEQMRYWMLSNWNYENPVGETMAMWSPLLLISGYLAVVWEVLFAFLVFQRRGRLVMLAAGVAFHFMTWVTLGLKIFPLICISGYFSFLMQDDVLKLRHLLQRWRLSTVLSMPVQLGARTLSAVPTVVPAGVAWTCLVALTAIVTTEVELQMDLYGIQRPEGAMPLAVMDPAVARSMIHDKQPVRLQDKFFSFDIGSYTIGNQLANRKNQFTYGQTMIAQCNLNPPHEDLWVECQLQDEDGRTIEQFGQFVTRDMLRAPFTYTFGNKLPPGNYDMVLRSGNREIYRRPFSLSGTPLVCPIEESVLTN